MAKKQSRSGVERKDKRREITKPASKEQKVNGQIEACIGTLVSWLPTEASGSIFQFPESHHESVLSGQWLYGKKQNECCASTCWFCGSPHGAVGARRALRSPRPRQARAGQSAGEHTGAASWGQTQGLSLKPSAGSAADSEALGIFPESLILQHLSLMAASELSAFLKCLCICRLLLPLLLLTGFKSHQLLGRHPKEVTLCKTPEYPWGQDP